MGIRTYFYRQLLLCLQLLNLTPIQLELTFSYLQLTIKSMPSLKKVHGSWFMVHRFKKETTNYEQPTTNRKSKGFTLIELLVVIAIIGILASLATYSYTDSQKKARDNRRKSDLVAIQKALELAKQDTAGNYSYPRCYTAAAVSCVLTEPDPVAHPADDRETSPVLSPTYIKAIPYDPKTGTGYTYQTWTDNTYTTGCSTSGACTAFSLVACLENSKDPQQDPNAPGGSLFPQNATVCSTAGTVSYTITNL